MNIYISESNGDVLSLKTKSSNSFLFEILSNEVKTPLVVPMRAAKPLKEMSANDFVASVLKKFEVDASSVTKKELNTLHNLGYERTTFVIDSAI